MSFKNKIKKYAVIALIGMVSITSTILTNTSYAMSNSISKNNLEEEIHTLLKSKGYDIEKINPNQRNATDFEFDTIEEFEAFLEKTELEYNKNKDIVEEIDVSNNKNSKSSTTISDYHFKQDSEQWTIFYKRNMRMKYEFKRVNGNAQFVRVFDRNAYPTGITVGEWKVHKGGYTQTYTKKYNTRDTVINKINGQWKATASVAGIPVGFTKDQTWTFTLWIR